MILMMLENCFLFHTLLTLLCTLTKNKNEKKNIKNGDTLEILQLFCISFRVSLTMERDT
jgi:hypothetical protein